MAMNSKIAAVSVTKARRGQPGRSASVERAGPRREVLTTEVLDKAAFLFATRGFAATSLQDIANEIGLSRTSIYYYFPSKEALLEELVRGVTQRPATILSELGSKAYDSHSARLAEAARQLVLWVTDPHTHFKLLDRAEGELPESLAVLHRETKRRVLHGLVGLIKRGMAAGEFRLADPNVAAFAVLGMCNWTAWWFSASGKADRKEIADQIATLATSMIQGSAKATPIADVNALLRSIREDLDRIEAIQAGGSSLKKKSRQPAPN